MKKIAIINLLIFSSFIELNAQAIIKMQRENGIYYIQCKVNNIPLKMIFDTGASNVSIALAEAIVMYKSGTLTKNDIIGVSRYQVANGTIESGTIVNLKRIELGELVLFNVQAIVMHSLDAPLLLGQSVLEQLGKIQVDYSNSSIIILNSKSSKSTSFQNSYSFPKNFTTTLKNNYNNIEFYSNPNVQSNVLMYIPRYHTINVEGIVNLNFFKANIDGKTGYVLRRYVKDINTY